LDQAALHLVRGSGRQCGVEVGANEGDERSHDKKSAGDLERRGRVSQITTFSAVAPRADKNPIG
jgi:hypothetical protein